MIGCLIVVGLAFVWLGYETEWMTVRLPCGAIPIRSAQYIVHYTLGRSKWNGNCRVGGTVRNFDKTYDIFLSPGIDNILCSWEWLDEHCADLVDYQPLLEISAYGVTHKMHIKTPTTNLLKDISKATMKVSRTERKQWQLSHV